MSKTLLYAFIGGALVGAGVAVLFAPQKGSDLRKKIKEALRKKGILCPARSAPAAGVLKLYSPYRALWSADMH